MLAFTLNYVSLFKSCTEKVTHVTLVSISAELFTWICSPTSVIFWNVRRPGEEVI